MLEREIAHDLALDIVESGTQAGVVKVVSARISIGALRVLDEMLFRSELVKNFKGTIAEGTHIDIERPVGKMRCAACGHEYEFTVGVPATYDCPACGSDKHELVSGMEVDILDIRGILPSMSLADKLAKAVEDKLGPVEKPANPVE